MRQQEQEQEQDDRGSFLFIRVIESLSLQDHHSSDGMHSTIQISFTALTDFYHVMEV